MTTMKPSAEERPELEVRDDSEVLYDMDEGLYCLGDIPYTGLVHQRSRAGVLISEESFVDGVLDGICRYWYPNGQPMQEKTFRGNSAYGPVREWHKNGQIKREALMDYGIRLRDRKWDEAGVLTEDYTLSEGDPYFKTVQRRRMKQGG